MTGMIPGPRAGRRVNRPEFLVHLNSSPSAIWQTADGRRGGRIIISDPSPPSESGPGSVPRPGPHLRAVQLFRVVPIGRCGPNQAPIMIASGRAPAAAAS